MRLESQYKKLEELQDEFQEAEKLYFQLRYLYWQALHKIKKLSPLKMDFKEYSGQVRRDCKRKQRLGQYGKRPRGCDLDHSIPILWFYCSGETDLNVINSRENCVWIKKTENRKKGIKRC
jgi:hypothetical protein